MGQARLPARRGLGCCILVLLLLLGGSGSPETPPPPRGPWAEEQGAVPEEEPWGRARYEVVKKHLGAVGALSKQYWQYVACKVWQQGCEEEEKEQEERQSSAIPSKHLALFSPCAVARKEQQGRTGCCAPGSCGAAFPSRGSLPRAPPALA